MLIADRWSNFIDGFLLRTDFFVVCNPVIILVCRSDPINSFSWGSESVISVRWNPAEPDVFATTGSDRSIVLYDMRVSTPLRKLIMQVRTGLRLLAREFGPDLLELGLLSEIVVQLRWTCLGRPCINSRKRQGFLCCQKGSEIVIGF